MSMLRSIFDPILGNAKWKQNQGRVTLIYRYESEIQPIEKMRIKIEINTREHFNVLGFKNEPFSVESTWFSGQTNITTYHLEELLGTKLRALHQRKKGRDLFDFHCFLQNDTGCDWEKVALCFTRYIEEEGTQSTRAMFEKVLLEKLKEPLFTKDVNPLLSSKNIKLYNPEKTAVALMERVLPYLRGEPYKHHI